MSFLFGKKKETKGVGVPPASRDGNVASGANSSIPTANGMKGRERGPGTTQSPTPGSSVDNSINSGGGAHTPSPEQGLEQRGGPAQEQPVCHTVRESRPTSYCSFYAFRTSNYKSPVNSGLGRRFANIICPRSMALDLASMVLRHQMSTLRRCILGHNDD